MGDSLSYLDSLLVRVYLAPIQESGLKARAFLLMRSLIQSRFDSWLQIPKSQLSIVIIQL